MKRFALFWLFTLLCAQASATELRVAVASNFTPTLERLAQAYQAEYGVQMAISSGSSGKHFAQIRQGAPFDLFFSADNLRTAELVESGQALPESRFVYAQGVLVLWSPDPERIPADALALLRQGDYRRLAMANPRVAPYGTAAEAVIEAHGIQVPRGRLVTGQSIGHAFNFIITGNAELGFVALSQAITWERQHGQGSRWLPDTAHYPPILQEAVQLRQARDPEAAHRFLDWVRNNPEARAIIEADGYRLPPIPEN
ncbi:molybdate ABC transporter substrate-binding protein [Thioalkalivibrio sulfidiphilus]|uniref:molybdate ABC transporter substrate-binding protein n=1 Tax=Thioalkalivibrio sulfidiphilus TaxID=1033854 RepID=UPI0003A83AC9|nr:molybdate ABC transporter substrate-binding protein [Thioalkalivibrio sulfidiphilus]